jgi:hypothetical protein
MGQFFYKPRFVELSACWLAQVKSGTIWRRNVTVRQAACGSLLAA